MASIKKVLHGNNKNQLKSPTVKRSPSSSVILQGWLFKQGSDGLMLWKKRWFVLADYCLFYYKSAAEEKLLGSFLLASYKISPCSSEDKIYRKFSFKAEHVNMRTYYFSAESQSSMIQWINALSLASICQQNPSENLDNGKVDSWVVSEQQPLYVNTRVARPALSAPQAPPKPSTDTFSNKQISYNNEGLTALSSPTIVPFTGPYKQELYRKKKDVVDNRVPPVPIRNDIAYYNRTVLQDNFQTKKCPPRPHSADFLEHDFKEMERNNSRTSKSDRISKLARPKSSLDVIRYNDYGYDCLHWSEEAYAEKMRQTSMYVTPQQYKTQDRTLVGNMQHDDNSALQQSIDDAHIIRDPRFDVSYNSVNKFSRSASARCPSHSKADNMTYEGNSLTRKTTDDKDTKSTEEHEELMRRLLVWKQRMLQSPLTRKGSSGSARQSLICNNPAIEKKLKQDFDDSTLLTGSSSNSDVYSDKYNKKNHVKENDKYLWSDDDDLNVGLDRTSSTHTYPSSYAKKIVPAPVNSDGSRMKSSSNRKFYFYPPLADKSIPSNQITPDQKSRDYVIDMQDIDCTSPFSSAISQDKKSINSSCDNVDTLASSSTKHSDSGYSTLQDGNSFPKGSGLNLSQSNYSYDSTCDNHQTSEKEWGSKLDESRVIKEFSYHYIHAKNDDTKHTPGIEGDGNTGNCAQENFESKAQSVGSVKFEQMRQSPFKNPFIGKGNTVCNPTVSDLSDNSGSDSIKVKSSSIHSFDKFYSSACSSSDKLSKLTSCSDYSKEKMYLMESNGLAISSDDDRDEEVTAVLAKHEKVAHNAQCITGKHIMEGSAEGENSESELSNLAIPLVSSPDCDDDKTKEEHYMPMTPKKKVNPSPDNESIYVTRNTSVSSFYPAESNENIIEESSYVEMSHNSTVSSSNGGRTFKPNREGSVTPCSSEVQIFEDNPDYEYISKENSSEPVYVELSQSFREKKKTPLKSSLSNDSKLSKGAKDRLYYSSLKHSLPDILNTSHNTTKSDSSDADDEASKDLECISTPTHPRFSLSDTFRPASYYLGANHSPSHQLMERLNLEQQDSSDSDLMSPPPIPINAPSVNELGLSLDLVKTCSHGSKEEKEGYWKLLAPGSKDHKSIKLSDRYLSRPVEDLSSETESNDSLRKEQLLKRRPVSADILDNLSESNFLSSSPSSRRKSIASDIESISFSNVEERSVNFDNFTQDLQVNDQFLESLIKNNTDNISNILNIDASLEKQSSMDSRFKINNMIWEYGKKNNDIQVEGDKVYKKPCNCVVNTCVPASCPSSQSPSIAVNNQSGAPYYYSDIIKSGGAINAQGPSDGTQFNPALLMNNNRVRKPNNTEANSSEGLERPRYTSSQALADTDPSDSNLGEYVCLNKNINTPNVMSKEQKGISSKLLCRSLTPDFYGKKLATSKSSKLSKNIISLKDMSDNSIRRVRSFEGLLDSSDTSDDKPRILGHSPSNAIYKLLQTTQGCNQQHTDGSVYPTEPALPSVSKSLPQQPCQNLRLAKSLDNIRFHQRPGARKTQTMRNSPHLSDFQEEPQTSNYCSSSVRNLSHGDKHSVTQIGSQNISDSKLIGICYPSDNKHERVGWDTPQLPPAPQPLPPSAISSTDAECIAQSKNTSSHPIISNDNWNLELSAGELLGRTHEELVLLLIQLRRRSSGLCKAIDDFQKEISSKVRSLEQDQQDVSRNEQLKKQLLDLEKQYEKGKPLVNLVDNMVKLGSLYHNKSSAVSSQRLEFNHKIEEQRLLAQEKKEWQRLRPDEKQLQEKVKQLYEIDQILKDESNTLQNLQQDKNLLEQALIGLKQKLDSIHCNPLETEQCRHEQRMLERGLSRVRYVLASNSKKLEETVAENARLEQELVILKQKLQYCRKSAESTSSTLALETELKKVQDSVNNLQRQRQQLCSQVCQLTEKSNLLSQQLGPSDSNCCSSTNPKRKTSCCWVETDLDSHVTQDSGIESQYGDQNMTSSSSQYDSKKTCIIHKEKPQEIKTVRIVKRESERRQRDRERNCTLGIPLTNMISRRETITEELSYTSSPNEMSDTQSGYESYSDDSWKPTHPPPLTPRTDSVNAVKNFVSKHRQTKEESQVSSAPAEKYQSEIHSSSTEDGAPIYLSKAAQEIVQEVAWRKKGEKKTIAKEKRRYHTVSGQAIAQQLSKMSSVGSRDDLDMERALRNRMLTPDVVRSTFSRDAKFTAQTIDTILGTPSKIVIPERYKPENEPQVSKEEQLQRSRKADAIRKMLTQSGSVTTPATEGGSKDLGQSSAHYKYKMAEEKQQREHLLQLNQILAQQVTEKSKQIIAGLDPS